MDSINFDIQRKLTAAGIPSAVLTWNEKTDSYGLISKEEQETCWVLKFDGSVGDDDGGKKWNELYKKNGMEMSSPPYYYTETALDAIRTVLRTLKSNYRVRVDNTTGLHVHVGNSYNGLQLPILKRLSAIVYTYEPQLLLIMSEDRVDSEFCPPLCLSNFSLQNPKVTRREFLENILGYTDSSTLVEDLSGLTGVGRLGFNFENLKTPYTENARTIEFRHHHGSLDSDAICNWIHVCVKIVEKAFFAKSDELLMRLRQDVSKPLGLGGGELSTIDFLMWLGCPAQAYYYGIKIVADKATLEDRIKNDAIRQQRSFIFYVKQRLWGEKSSSSDGKGDGDDEDESEDESEDSK